MNYYNYQITSYSIPFVNNFTIFLLRTLCEPFFFFLCEVCFININNYLKLNPSPMKTKISLLLILFALFYGCTTSSSDTTTAVIPLAPSSLNGVVASTTQINLSWTDNSTNETGFKIERKTGTASYAVVGTVNTDVLTYNDLGLTPNTSYTYRVCSYNSVGISATYSNELTLTTSSVSA